MSEPVIEPVRLKLFGLPTLVRGGIAEALPFERRSQLLVLLALRGGWVGRSEAAALLWPQQEGKLAHSNLRKTLFRLPALPWGHLVQAQGGALRFDGASDVAAFEAALRDQRLGDALAEAGGDILARGFDDDANEAWTAWLGFERERLRAAWRGAALTWLGAQAGPCPGADAAGPSSAPAALALATQMLEADPFDEAALGAQLRWLQRSGQDAAARQAYRRFAERLQAELGIAPGAALAALGDALEVPGSHLEAPSEADAGAKPTVVPVAGARGQAALDAGFVGRGAELRRIASLLEQDDCRLLTLLGPGGVGKTRLAERTLQELGAGFAHGVAFVALEDVADEAGFGAALARALSQRADGPGDALAPVIAALQGRHMLIALDNFEQLAGDALMLARLLEGCAGLKLLVTSRVRLALAAEWTVALEGLPCPDPEDLDRAEAFDAVRLFVRAARRVEPAFAPAAETAAIAEICRLVEGLPLALELAAGWVRLLSCADIAAELRAGIELLRAEDAAQPRRHASIEQVFEQSWQRLAPVERALLARLAVFRAGFTPAAARAVAGASLPVLGALVDKSLLHKDGQDGARKDGTRLKLHPLVQQLAWLALDEPERRATADAHASHCLHELVRLRRAVEMGEREALQRLDAELENHRAAWAHATGSASPTHVTAHGQARLLADAALALCAHADHRGLRAAGLALMRRGLATPAAARQPLLRAVLLAAGALLEHRLGRDADAEAGARQALALAADLDRDAGDGDPAADVAGSYDAQVMALKVLGLATMRMDRLDEARAHHEAALRLAGASSDPHNVALLLGNQALIERRQGRHAEAERLLEQALQEHRRLGDFAREARALNNLGAYACDLRRFDAARAHLHAALALCERHGLQATLALVLGNLCYVALEQGELDEAARLGQRALAEMEQTGDPAGACSVRHMRALLALRRGDAALAATELAAATALARQLGQAGLLLLGAVVFAQWLAAAGEHAGARAVLGFVDGHPAAAAHVRREARHTLAGLQVPAPDDAPAGPWPALTLDELGARLVDEAPAGYAALRALARPPPP